MLRSPHRAVVRAACALGALFSVVTAHAQSGAEALDALSLEDLLNRPVNVASTRARSLRESPAVVTVLGHDELVRNGARDLLDALLLVPGFAPGVDVQNVVDLGFRGNWAHEGKMLLLIDGQEMNEDLYASLQLGTHFPIDHIRSIEIIRGPGSAVYGGYAELAVISVTTFTGADLQGARGAVQLGVGRTGLIRRTLSLQYGQTFEKLDGMSVKIAGYVGKAQRSEGTYTDPNGESVVMDHKGFGTDPLFLNAALTWRMVTLRAMFDGYRLNSADGFGELAAPSSQAFSSLRLESRADLHPFEHLSVTPRLTYKWETPWFVWRPESPLYYAKSAQRLAARIRANYDVTDFFSVAGGAEWHWLRGKLLGAPGALNTDFAGSRHAEYFNAIAFTELNLDTVLGNLVAGIRVEHHSVFGTSIVPRITITRVIERMHFKLLFARAFRAPAFENINLGVDVKPERSRTLEAELGYQVDDHVFISANLFDTAIDGAIVYSVTDNVEGYANVGRAGTRGAEVALHAQGGWGSLDVNYSAYTASGRNTIDTYAVPGQPNLLLGLPAHKIAMHADFLLTPDVSLAPSAIFMSERWAATSYDDDGNLRYERLKPTVLLNLGVQWRNAGMRGLDLSVTMHNILDAQSVYPQPYAGGHPPVPGPGREVVARLAHAIDL